MLWFAPRANGGRTARRLEKRTNVFRNNVTTTHRSPRSTTWRNEKPLVCGANSGHEHHGMSQWIIIDWGDAPLRLIATTIRDRQVTLTRMAALPTASRREPAMLINTLQSWRVAKAQLVVLVDRADCEVRGFQVPPVPADELPDIVRFQALQHFVSLDDGSPIDFLPAQADNAEQVLAAALPLEHLRQIQKVCDAVGASLLGVIFRPCGSAAAVAHALGDTRISDETRLILTDEGTKVDLTLARGPLVFMSRSVRLTADDTASAALAADPASSRLAANREFILNEVKRTLAAARVQNATTTIASLVICGASPAHEALATECQQVFGLPAECVDHPPRWHRVAEAEAMADAEAEHFAPLVGAACLRPIPIGRALTFSVHGRHPSRVIRGNFGPRWRRSCWPSD